MKRFFNFSKKRMNIHSEKKSQSNFLAFSNLQNAIWTPRDYGALAREGYKQNAIAYRCVRLIAENVASIGFEVRDAKGNLHEFQSLIDNPNIEQSFTELIEAFIGHLQIAGNAYLELIDIDGKARELCVLRPDTMQIVLGNNGWPIAWVQQICGQKRKLWRDNISGKSQCLHLKLFNPIDDLYGQSPIEAAANSIDIHNAGGAWNKSLIDNAARPSGALVYKGANGYERLSDEQFDRLKDELTLAHTGAANAGRPLLLEGGLEWSPMSLSPQEMDFVEARRQAARDIALAFGIPPMLLGIPGDNTFANYKEANNAFWRQVVLPLSQKLGKSLAQFLSPWAGCELIITQKLDKVPALIAETESLWARLEAASFLTIAEKRQLAGLGGENV
jgi:HK97 family phage portal protein